MTREQRFSLMTPEQQFSRNGSDRDRIAKIPLQKRLKAYHYDGLTDATREFGVSHESTALFGYGSRIAEAIQTTNPEEKTKLFTIAAETRTTLLAHPNERVVEQLHNITRLATVVFPETNIDESLALGDIQSLIAAWGASQQNPTPDTIAGYFLKKQTLQHRNDPMLNEMLTIFSEEISARSGKFK
jgi:hypothetical protein